ncbi:pyridoxamine kinase [Cellulosilyticum ruminicola]|uniref:pyridoxamine kinase n=1 Tax=Cellulosilyticum ruminicola TaxID=425254 RepID=UPI0006CF9629|nr:pyridoxamine kinase [Cellulosilyticum ruminicola]
MKRAAIINDLSGIGRCSLNVAIAILSVLEVQACPLPTAVLSNQTGFKEFSFLDFTPHMQAYYTHWKKLNREFDAIYSGFLGSTEQVEIIIGFVERFKKENTLVLIDPVMGDNGVLYPIYETTYPEDMKRLVALADVVTPNITELKLLLGIPLEEKMTREELRLYQTDYDKHESLKALGPKKIIVTGLIEEDQMYSVGIDLEKDEWYEVKTSYNHKSYSGTGDIFASILCGALTRGAQLKDSIELATHFIGKAIEYTEKVPNWDTRDGIMFEKFLKELSINETS